MSNKTKERKQKKSSIIKPAKARKVGSTKPKKSSSNLLVGGIAVILLVSITMISYFAFSAVFETDTYYVLNTDVVARQEITVDMLSEQETSLGSAPKNEIGMERVQQGGVFAKYPLYAGDVLSTSNAGSLELSSLGIPDSWAITSIDIPAGSAVGGALMRGDFIDILGVNEDGARYIFNNVLVLDVSYSSQEITSGDSTIIDNLIRFTLGMPAEDIAMLHSANFDYEGLLLTKAPSSVMYAGRNTTGLEQTFKFGDTVLNKDLFEGADPTFSPVVREENLVPVNKVNCANGIIKPSDLCDELGFPKGTGSQEPAPEIEEVPEVEVETPEDNEADGANE